MSIQILTIVGVGLIGGSIGLAARRRGVATKIIGAGRRLESLRLAQDLGAIDELSLDLSAAVQRADLAVFCTPVDQIVGQVLAAAPACRRGTILTDAGSTKAGIVRALQGHLPKGVAFVGSHPLAGSEKRGPEHADANLFQNRLTLVTPAGVEEAFAVDRVVAFWNGLGSRTRIMSPEEHDSALALTSHLPHLVASALAGILPPELGTLVATGFRDTTRIAAGDPGIWTAIFEHNRPAVLNALQDFSERLDRYRSALEQGDRQAIASLLMEGKKVRDALGS